MHASNQLRRIHAQMHKKTTSTLPLHCMLSFHFRTTATIKTHGYHRKSGSNELKWTQTRETEQNQIQNRHAELLADGTCIYNYICGGGDDIYIYTNACIQQTGPSSNNT